MKQFFAFSLLALLCLSVVAWRMQPRPSDPNKIPLIWASDDNPARRDQIKLFNATSPGYELRLDPNNTGLEKVIVQSIAGVGPDIFDTGEANCGSLRDRWTPVIHTLYGRDRRGERGLDKEKEERRTAV
jgi:hypothetical protein